MNGSFWLVFPENPGLSAATAAIAAMLFLYAARGPMHQLFRSSGRAVAGPLRLAARWLLAAADDIQRRNKAVLLAHARHEVESSIEWEFERVSTVLGRDLTGYPALQRKLMDEIARIEEDYRTCGEVPPPPPDWVEALAAVTSLKSAGGEMVTGILGQISGSMERIHGRAIAEYRRSYDRRHRILRGFLPFWRSVEKSLARIDGKLARLQASAAAMDAHMDRYREICAQSDREAQVLTLSAFTQLVISALVLVVAGGAALVNFNLIAPPMTEMVGAGDAIAGGLRASELAALLIILLEASLGLFMMESLRITHLFPRIAMLRERARRRMFWVSFTLLVALAAVGASLALMRDATQPAAAAEGWIGMIPSAAQVLLGLMLPFALAFVAIPLEALVHSLRTVAGVLLLAVARVVAFALRGAGQAARHASGVLISAYDVLIVLPLFVERLARAGSAQLPATQRRLS